MTLFSFLHSQTKSHSAPIVITRRRKPKSKAMDGTFREEIGARTRGGGGRDHQ